MAEIRSAGERVGDGEAALDRGAWPEAWAIFEAELERGETIAALEGLSWSAWWMDDLTVCVDARERAYRLCRRAHDGRRVAMIALWLGDDHLVLRGGRAVANGWFQRAAGSSKTSIRVTAPGSSPPASSRCCAWSPKA